MDKSNREFYANFDFSIFDVKTEAKIEALIDRIRRIENVESIRKGYDASVDGYKRSSRVLFSHINQAPDQPSAATPDMYQCFAERATQLLRLSGYLGCVYPSAFHANEGASGISKVIPRTNESFMLL